MQNMLLSTLKLLSVEEDEEEGGGVAVLERGAAKVEGTSLDMRLGLLETKS
jgi:hypothetical protein